MNDADKISRVWRALVWAVYQEATGEQNLEGCMVVLLQTCFVACADASYNKSNSEGGRKEKQRRQHYADV